MDTSDPQAPKIVHAFMPRDSEGYSSKESWDVLGIFAWALMGFGNIYCAMAQRALDLTVETVKKKTSLGVSRSMAYHPGVQQGVAEMVLELEGVGPHLEPGRAGVGGGVDHGAGWVIKILAAKYHAVESSWRVVDKGLDLAGGFGIFKKGPFEQLFRDARLGRIHPANAMLTHELCAKLTLGISPDGAAALGLRGPAGGGLAAYRPDR